MFPVHHLYRPLHLNLSLMLSDISQRTPFVTPPSIFISSKANKEAALYVVSESKGTEHELTLGLPDDGNDGSVCPAASGDEEKGSPVITFSHLIS